MPGVIGETNDNTAAVQAINTSLENDAGPGLLAKSRAAGVWGESSTWIGVYGKSELAAGVMGEGLNGDGIQGISDGGAGIVGFTKSGPAAIFGHTGGAGNAVRGEHEAAGLGVFGSTVSGLAGVFGQSSGDGAAIRGDHTAGGLAGFFTGNVGVTGHINCNGNLALLGDCQLLGADVAEQFCFSSDSPAPPGSVMVLAGVDSVRVSDRPYDQLVAGIVSGAGNYRPGIVLDRQDKPDRGPLALSGKVWCWVDADIAPISLGDLLTTSATPGHAMRATDRVRAFGAVIGKALGELTAGRGLIPVLVALQ